ncbi:MAG: DUF1232 domain-containing protein [Oscillatoria sp. SIO1A7]|nr:DUF1232 domain-containing protein [Oscillatoria sp. SIO1A7]
MKLPAQWIFNLYRTGLRNPTYRWGLIVGTFIYLLSPIDISPDLIPLLGQIDDFALVMLLVTGLSQLIGEWMQRQQLEVKSNSTENNDNSANETKTVDVKAVSID